jgi:hypothetical protein
MGFVGASARDFLAAGWAVSCRNTCSVGGAVLMCDDRTDLAFLLTSFATTGAAKGAKCMQDGDISPALTAQTSCVSEDEQVNEYSLDSARQGPTEIEDKHLRRMKRNRESAALSRSRKKAYVEELLAKVQELDAKVLALQSENAHLKRECVSLAPSASADLPASRPAAEQGPSSEGSMAPLVMPHSSSSLPGPRSPPGHGSESGRASSRARAEPGSPNTRRGTSRSKTVEGAGRALLEMTGGGSAPASPRCTALPVC